MDAEGAAGKSKAKRQWKKIDPGQILDIQSYEDQRKGSEVKGKGKQNEKGKGRGNGKGENGEGKGKGKGGKNAAREEDPVAETSPQSAERSYQPRASPKGGRRDGKGKGGGRRKGSFQSPQGGSGFQAEEPAPEDAARNAQHAPPQAAAAHMAGSQFPAVGKGAGGMGAYMQPAPMGQMPYEMVPMQMFPSPFMGGMGMPYMGYTPDGMMGSMAMAPGALAPMGSSQATTSQSPQRNDLVAKAKTQIEYYFSVNNLVKDVHLRKNVMDTQGWVSFSGLIAFPKLQQLTRTGEHASGDPTIILDAISELPQLEMKPDNSAVRLKDNWQKWVWQASDN